MAIYHLSTKPIGVARSAVAAAAYRAGVEMVDRNTGEVYDFSRRSGILREDGGIVLPDGAPDWAGDRQELWNRAQDSSRNNDGTMRKNGRYAREFEVSLPHELTQDQRKELGREFAKELSSRFNVPVQYDFHTPGGDGDNRNEHMHIMLPTRELGPDGWGRKTAFERADRDLKKEGLPTTSQQLIDIRKTWADMSNRVLERAGHEERIDHRSLKTRYTEAMERGDYESAEKYNREPTKHMGPAVTSIERGKPLYRDGQKVPGEYKEEPKRTERGDVNRRIELASQMGKIQREKEQVGRSIIDTESSIADAKRERDGFRSFLTGQRDNAGSRGTEKQPQRPDWSSMREQAGSRGSGRTERDEQAERIAAAIKHYAAYAEPRPSPLERERETPQIILDSHAPAAPRPSLRERFGHLATPKESPTRQDQPERTPAQRKEQQMEQLAGMPPAQPGRDDGAALRRVEQQQQQPKQEQPTQKQEQDQARRQEQQNQLQQIAARMEQNRLERERRRQEQERNGHDMSR